VQTTAHPQASSPTTRISGEALLRRRDLVQAGKASKFKKRSTRPPEKNLSDPQQKFQEKSRERPGKS